MDLDTLQPGKGFTTMRPEPLSYQYRCQCRYQYRYQYTYQYRYQYRFQYRYLLVEFDQF